MSFNEKSHWLMIVIVLAIFGVYFFNMLGGQQVNFNVENADPLIWAIVLTVIVSIVGHIILAIFDRDFTTDERDKFIYHQATKIKSFIIDFGCLAAIGVAIMTEGNFWVVHALLATLVLGELVENGMQVFYYRRDAL